MLPLGQVNNSSTCPTEKVGFLYIYIVIPCEGTHFFCTSSKGAQLLLYPMANALYQSKLLWSAFFVISHSYFFPSTLKTTKFTNFHRSHSVLTDFQDLEKHTSFPQNFKALQTVQTLMSHTFSSLHCIYFEIFYFVFLFWELVKQNGSWYVCYSPHPPTFTGKCQVKSNSYFNQASQ